MVPERNLKEIPKLPDIEILQFLKFCANKKNATKIQYSSAFYYHTRRAGRYKLKQ